MGVVVTLGKCFVFDSLIELGIFHFCLVDSLWGAYRLTLVSAASCDVHWEWCWP